MREHRVIHKPTRQIIIPNVPSHALAADGKFYTRALPLDMYVDTSGAVAIDEWTGALDKKGIKIFENDIVLVGLRAFDYSESLGDHVGWVEAHAIIVYSELAMGFQLEVLTPQYQSLPEDTDWEVHEVLGNRWQNPDLVERFRPRATATQIP